MSDKPRLAVHKFSSCDGCQLALLNLGEALLDLAALVEIVHFAEAGVVDEQAAADIALIEGSISTAHDLERIAAIRANSGYLISIGACATAGGIQALRNLRSSGGWAGAIYAQPQYLDSLATATPIAAHVKVDAELWGCPVDAGQLLRLLRDRLSGVTPALETEPVCQECKRAGHACVLVSDGQPCLGPVTRAGCGALCPGQGRACYGCFGPAEPANTHALQQRLGGLGLSPVEIAHRFHFITAAAPAFRQAGEQVRGAGQ